MTLCTLTLFRQTRGQGWKSYIAQAREVSSRKSDSRTPVSTRRKEPLELESSRSGRERAVSSTVYALRSRVSTGMLLSKGRTEYRGRKAAAVSVERGKQRYTGHEKTGIPLSFYLSHLSHVVAKAHDGRSTANAATCNRIRHNDNSISLHCRCVVFYPVRKHGFAKESKN